MDPLLGAVSTDTAAGGRDPSLGAGYDDASLPASHFPGLLGGTRPRSNVPSVLWLRGGSGRNHHGL